MIFNLEKFTNEIREMANIQNNIYCDPETRNDTRIIAGVAGIVLASFYSALIEAQK